MSEADKILHQVLSALSQEKVIIPNWFFKHDVEQLVGRKISEDEFKKIMDAVNESLAEKVSDEVAEVALQVLGEK